MIVPNLLAEIERRRPDDYEPHSRVEPDRPRRLLPHLQPQDIGAASAGLVETLFHQRSSDSASLIRGVDVESHDLESALPFHARGRLMTGAQVRVPYRRALRIFSDEDRDIRVVNRGANAVDRKRASEVTTELRLGMRWTVSLRV